MRSTYVFMLVFAMTCLAPVISSAQSAAGPVGVVLLHGKSGAPDMFVSGLAGELRSAGYLVAVPEMPWSKRRGYSAGYLEALAEVDASVKALRAKGAVSVVVAGHSLGANAALGYAARYPGLAGIICLAPGHSPEMGKLREMTVASVAKARELAATGQGDTPSRYPDLNMGKSFDITVTANVFLSYFDPEGPAVMPRNAALIKPALPILWVAGERDPLSKSGPGYAFDLAPVHPQSRYATVEADHLGTPSAAVPVVLEWLKGLPR